MKVFSQIVLVAAFMVCSYVSVMSMGKEGEGKADQSGPVYVALNPDQGIYHGTITNNKRTIPVTKISFSGDTYLAGVPSESSDSYSRLKFSDIALVTIDNPYHKSERYPSQEYARATVVTKSGVTVKDLLFPRHLVVCAQHKESGIEQAWYFRSIDSLTFQHA